MLTYLFDGSFEGLLTAIFEAYYRKEYPEKIILHTDSLSDLFSTFVNIKTDYKKSDRVFASIKEKISYNALTNVYYTYLSELEKSPTFIYEYLRLGWRIGNKVDLHLTDQRVLNVHNTIKKVTREAHLMLGLVRFQELQGKIYYSTIEPDFNILSLIAKHFVSRFSDQFWIIHDIKRHLALIYDKSDWYITNLEPKENLSYSTQETFYQDLWKSYFKSAAIENKTNAKLQKRCMPTRYWKHLLEKTR